MKMPDLKLGTRGLKLLFLMLLAALSINVCEATRVSIGIGTAYSPDVEWIPGHWYHGYWIPGQYVEYAGPAPGEGYVWVQGGFYGDGHHWHRGHWHGGHHH